MTTNGLRQLAEGTGLEPVTLSGDALAGRFLVPSDAFREKWWIGRGSNPEPSACEADALPIELRDPYLVGTEGIEPPSSWSQAKRRTTRQRPSERIGGPSRIRTENHCLTRGVLYLLELTALLNLWRRVKDSNLHATRASVFGTGAIPVPLQPSARVKRVPSRVATGESLLSAYWSSWVARRPDSITFERSVGLAESLKSVGNGEIRPDPVTRASFFCGGQYSMTKRRPSFHVRALPDWKLEKAPPVRERRPSLVVARI